MADRKQERKTLQARAQRDKRVEPEEPEVPEPKAEERKPEPKLDMKKVPPPFARGAVIWPYRERQIDRYGFIGLQDTELAKGFDPKEDKGKGDDDFETQEILEAHLDLDMLREQEDKQVYLVLTVVGARQSPHMGDTVRGIKASTPQVGEQIVLGPGKLAWYEDPDTGPNLLAGRWFGVWFGLLPDNPLKLTDWLDPVKLYRVLHQTVDVSIYPV